MQVSEPSGHAATEQQGGIVVLLDRLERQIAEDHLITPQDDNADDTIQAIAALLPNAPESEVKMGTGHAKESGAACTRGCGRWASRRSQAVCGAERFAWRPATKQSGSCIATGSRHSAAFECRR